MPRLRANRCACWFWQFLDARAGRAGFLELLVLAIAVAAALAAALAAVLVAAHTAVKSHNTYCRFHFPQPRNATKRRELSASAAKEKRKKRHAPEKEMQP